MTIEATDANGIKGTAQETLEYFALANPGFSGIYVLEASQWYTQQTEMQVLTTGIAVIRQRTYVEDVGYNPWVIIAQGNWYSGPFPSGVFSPHQGSGGLQYSNATWSLDGDRSGQSYNQTTEWEWFYGDTNEKYVNQYTISFT